MRRCTIDGTKIRDMAHLHTVLARELNFPHWYGRNLDALYDCLTDLSEETEIILRHTEALEEAVGEKAKGFFKTLKEVAKANPALRL